MVNVETVIPYTKVSGSRTLCYRYDVTKPAHCSVHGGVCSTSPLSLSSRITNDRVINVTFTGWEDIIPPGGASIQTSGIESYEITIHAVQDMFGEQEMEYNTWPGTNPIKIASNGPITLTLPDQNPALFAILITVKDVANNVQQARRFVLYDNGSQINTADHNKLYSTSASPAKNYTWQIHNNQVCFSWVGRYHNNKYIHKNVLHPIRGDTHGHISGKYEQMSGLLPVSGTPNVDGVTGFAYSLYKLPTQISVPQALFVNTIVSNTTGQHVCISHSPADGETLQFDLHLVDVVANRYNESLVIHVDTSPPVIENAWLVRDGHHQLYVHSTTDLSSMELQLDTFDPHSGLHSILWEFREKDGNNLLGSGYIGVQRLANVNT